jgi:hypothetical protein
VTAAISIFEISNASSSNVDGEWAVGVISLSGEVIKGSFILMMRFKERA